MARPKDPNLERTWRLAEPSAGSGAPHREQVARSASAMGSAFAEGDQGGREALSSLMRPISKAHSSSVDSAKFRLCDASHVRLVRPWPYHTVRQRTPKRGFPAILNPSIVAL